jgi:hypothetical protein
VISKSTPARRRLEVRCAIVSLAGSKFVEDWTSKLGYSSSLEVGVWTFERASCDVAGE